MTVATCTIHNFPKFDDLIGEFCENVLQLLLIFNLIRGKRSYLGHVPQLRPASTTVTCQWLLWKKDVTCKSLVT